MKKKIKPGDLLVYVFIVLLTAGSFVGLKLMQAMAPGYWVVVEVDGQRVESFDYSPNIEPRTVRIQAGEGMYNIVSVGYDGVEIAEANCRDQICVRMGKINSSGQSIVCLPHRLVVKIIGGGEMDVDDTAS